MKRTIINFAVVFGVLFVFGIFKVPFEIQMEKEMREKDLLPPKIDMSDRNGIGQAGYAAALGGFRDVLASYNYLKAHNLHVARDWYEMERTLNTVVTLQPRSEYYWEMAGWQLGNNTYSYEKSNHKISPFDRQRLSAEYFEKGDEYFKRGIKAMPHSYKVAMGRIRLLTDEFRMPNFEQALETAEHLMEHGEMDSNELLLAWGSYIYTLAATPGREVETYKELLKLFEVSNIAQRVPTQRVLIYVLQNELMIPVEDRMPDWDLLFDVDYIFDLEALTVFEIKVSKTPIEGVKKMYQVQRQNWEDANYIAKRDYSRAKLYILQNVLELSEEQKIPDDKLFKNEENKQYVINSVEYRKQLDLMKPKALEFHRLLVKELKEKGLSRNKRELLALLQIKNPQLIPSADGISLEMLLHNPPMKYQQLYYYWTVRNAMYQKMAKSGLKGFMPMPLGNIVSQLRELEDQLNVPDNERISSSQIFTPKPH